MKKSLSSDAFGSIVYSLCSSIGTARALSVWLCFRYNHEGLTDLPLADTATATPQEFALNHFITEYLTKYKGLKLGRDLRSVALEKWKRSEERCAETNMRFKTLRHQSSTDCVERALFRARRKIAAVLGSPTLGRLFADCRWGPGATYDLRRGRTHPDIKMTETISVTPSAARYLRSVLEGDPHWFEAISGCLPSGPFSVLPCTWKHVRGSRFLTVPKNAKTDRCIAAEPTGNSFLQQGIRGYIRSRLKRFGVDLDTQSTNQEAARIAYAEGLATLDLSAASDTISSELIYNLLPLDWAFLLDDLRSKETEVDGEWVRTEKFVSMGNAFCFELESLIFWALACSVDETQGYVDSICVYGDDIIVPRHAARAVVELLDYCGFSVNPAKSYFDGNFFESCGKHYFKGVDVTPVYQKELVIAPSEVIRAHNRLYRLKKRIFAEEQVHPFAKALREVRSFWPLRPFPRIPEEVPEDGGFLTPRRLLLYDRNHGFKCHVYDYGPRFNSAREVALYAYKLRRPEQQNPSFTGHAVQVIEGKWRMKVRYVPESAVLNAESR